MIHQSCSVLADECDTKSSCLSPQLYQRYVDTVTSTCDQIMHEAGPNWRSRCYATDMIMVVASLVEIDNRQHLDHIETRRRRHTDVNAMTATMQTLSESTPTPPSTERQTPIRTPLSIVTSSKYSSVIQTSPTTSPESSFSAPSASSLSTNITPCPLCPKVFKGRYSKTNMRRHKRYEHGNDAKPPCPICGAILSRSDNLGKHVKTVHGRYGGSAETSGH